tara:strand:+ start:390 stop:1610 length:1221 start_codon:yes stop_codon:yes gene_type:complete
MIKAGLDIGNNKISCVVADYKGTTNTNILSIKSTPTSNIKKNVIVNYDNLLHQIKTLIEETEKESQTKINSLNINISLLNNISNYYGSEIQINNDKITDLHIKKIINQSEYFNTDTNYFELFNNIISYEIDKRQHYLAPIGNYSDNLKINFYKILVQKKYIENFKNILNKLKLNVENFIPSPLSSSLSSLTKDEKELGSICIDLGHSTSSITVFQNNKFIFGDTISVGSHNITLDIARGVSTTISSAERLKTLYGSLISSPSDEHEIIEIPIISGEENSFNQITRANINAIIKPRVEETLEMLWQKIKDNNFENKKICNVVITGGGSQLDNLEKYVGLIFANSTRIAKPLTQFNLDKNYNKSNFCDILGTILYDESIYKLNFLTKAKNFRRNRGISGFFSWLDQYI